MPIHIVRIVVHMFTAIAPNQLLNNLEILTMCSMNNKSIAWPYNFKLHILPDKYNNWLQLIIIKQLKNKTKSTYIFFYFQFWTLALLFCSYREQPILLFSFALQSVKVAFSHFLHMPRRKKDQKIYFQLNMRKNNTSFTTIHHFLILDVMNKMFKHDNLFMHFELNKDFFQFNLDFMNK